MVGDPVAGLGGGFGGAVDSGEALVEALVDKLWRSWRDCAYRTVRACSSTGAPERTAAGVLSPGSLPSMTLIGIGEKFLSNG